MKDVITLKEYCKRTSMHPKSAYAMYKRGVLKGYQLEKAGTIFIYQDQNRNIENIMSDNKNLQTPFIPKGNDPLELLKLIIDLNKYCIRIELSKPVPDSNKINLHAKNLFTICSMLLQRDSENIEGELSDQEKVDFINYLKSVKG